MCYKVLVICDGNICRSPMAALLLADALTNLEVESAGLGAMLGERLDAEAAALMCQRGLDGSGHVARQFTQLMAKSAELILVMTETQKKAIESLYPFAKGRVFRVGEHEQFDVADPYLRGRVAFESALASIERGLTNWIPALRMLKG
jgi:protein-tyrosine phosphatase